jgi:hypothetical protein
MFSLCRQMAGTDGKVEEAVVGTKGISNCKDYIRVKGGELWRFRDVDTNPYHQEHIDLIRSLRAGQPINDARDIAHSTLTAIMGRESAYSGKLVERDQILNADRRLGPAQYAFGPLPFPEVPIPGKYSLA